ncbi:MAG: flagellar biosynthesis protein FlhB [Cyanobacteria bacterium NC_groundwater_1444_Ag_S-0.65um_54_12]|nr:flagellar biosynthesis protein FlhB [Cyanobacteria bacterium NC_groundwater_1444_Ag_S-0.65um_54_12]
MADSDRTEEATPKRISDARKKGNVLRSQDVTTAAILAAALLIIRLRWEAMAAELYHLMEHRLGHLPTGDLPPTFFYRVMLEDGLVALRVTAPIALFLLVVGIFTVAVQVGPLVTTEVLRPDLSKINPFTGFKRFFSARSFVELGKNILKIVVLTTIAWQVLADRYPMILSGLRASPQSVGAVLGDTAWILCLRLVIALIVIAVFDYLWHSYDYKRSLRMTKQEVKDEARQQEGDPLLKGEIKKRMRQAAMRRMMQQVPKATVVITNPTHYAIALLYRKADMLAPVVVASGVQETALRIRAIAAEHNVPIVENPPLARELHRLTDVGEEIPASLYAAIAEILVAIERVATTRAS